MEAKELRKRLADFRRSSNVRDYPRALVQDVVAYAHQRQMMGIKRHRIATELNVAQTTLNRWLQRSQDFDQTSSMIDVRKEKDTERLRQVAVLLEEENEKLHKRLYTGSLRDNSRSRSTSTSSSVRLRSSGQSVRSTSSVVTASPMPKASSRRRCRLLLSARRSVVVTPSNFWPWLPPSNTSTICRSIVRPRNSGRKDSTSKQTPCLAGCGRLASIPVPRSMPSRTRFSPAPASISMRRDGPDSTQKTRPASFGASSPRREHNAWGNLDDE
jgi:hypothetical protein